MPHINIPNNFQAKNTISAAAVNDNFTAITDGLKDGKKTVSVKDATIFALTSSDMVINADSLTLSSNMSILDGKTFFQTISLADPTGSTTAIVSGVISPECSNVALHSEAPGADDLDSITGTHFNTGDIINLFCVTSGDVITVKHGTGNITLNSSLDKTLRSDKQSIITLIYYDSQWSQIFYSGDYV